VTTETKLTEAIILAGGLGTRLRSAVPDLPKCMAPVNGRPFIAYVIQHLQQQGIENFIFSLGYKHEFFIKFLSEQFSGLSYRLSIEDEPLGTGGAIQFACSKASAENIVITNGDTLYKASIPQLATAHWDSHADCTLCLKPMYNFERYGVVEINNSGTITSFKEKQFYKEGLINGGLYALNIPGLLNKKLSEKFSFEKDFLEKFYGTQKFFGNIQNEYFIDIGIPEDYAKAQKEL
jgi:Nucleoside-diphosphate-sugar pyrophosphorylase involved in lipopolysaccharide biosynthesis/translation initiation factor 2B, gamma/epsilon subunits (eIF-2Bgamma/eIF-2Bepsilon)